MEISPNLLLLEDRKKNSFYKLVFFSYEVKLSSRRSQFEEVFLLGRDNSFFMLWFFFFEGRLDLFILLQMITDILVCTCPCPWEGLPLITCQSKSIRVWGDCSNQFLPPHGGLPCIIKVCFLWQTFSTTHHWPSLATNTCVQHVFSWERYWRFSSSRSSPIQLVVWLNVT